MYANTSAQKEVKTMKNEKFCIWKFDLALCRGSIADELNSMFYRWDLCIYEYIWSGVFLQGMTCHDIGH